ncbi:MAG: VWA domain-containing protein [Sulfuricurvum sp.]|uniref:VWA domain-containing protein n=1 Tax=Sulfuricurvum sp. TaxID=2025608 RepID=UPI002621A236|nr:VWA domain-containing protein [Sulfuricurvum sp.]MDD2368446.1 VWA domain-containing protein [Sulfuricurvum sp.]MDD5119028.1 VWA domain-containing protein [Sulfuricurvum sp.]
MAEIKFSVEKKAEGIKFKIEKKIGRSVSAQVCLLLDKSGSFEDEYQSGLVQEVLQNIFPFALVFDPDKSLDLFTFHHRSQERKSVTLQNWENYIKDQRLDRDNDWGNTYYAYPIEDALKKYGFLEIKKTGGFLGFNSTKTMLFNQNSSDGHPVICYLVTDGENADKSETDKLIKSCQDNKQNIYFMLIGIDNDGNQDFKFLDKLAKKYNNCGFVTIKDLRQSLKNDTFDELIFQDELMNWLSEKK